MGEETQNRKSSLYRHILKTLGIFGGSQAVSVICSLVRNKFAAMLLGTEGFGLIAIFNNAYELLTSATQLSIRQSAVRDVANAESPSALSRIATIVMRWAWVLGIIGAFITIAFSGVLSQYSFGDTSYALHFCAIAALVFVASIMTGWQVVIQGVEDYSSLAKSQLWGAVAGAVTSIPMYYLWGLASVIPSIAAYVITAFLATAYFRKRVPEPDPKPTVGETLREGVGFLRLGFYMTASVFATYLASYLYMGWLNANATIDDVGLFNSGNSVINRCAALIFTAIGYEYYPRLVKVIKSPGEVCGHVSSEINVILLVLLPIICIYLCFDNFFITLLYTPDFMVITPFMKWAMLGIVFKAVSWCMAFTILARGDGKLYIVTEVLSAIVYLVSHISFYRLYGIVGWGYAYLAWYIAYVAIIAACYVFIYRYKITWHTLKYFFIITVATMAMILSTEVKQNYPLLTYALAACFIFASGFILFKSMRKA